MQNVQIINVVHSSSKFFPQRDKNRLKQTTCINFFYFILVFEKKKLKCFTNNIDIKKTKNLYEVDKTCIISIEMRIDIITYLCVH